MKKLFKNVKDNQFIIVENVEENASDGYKSNEYKLAILMRDKISRQLEPLLDDNDFVNYIHRFPESRFVGNFRDSFSFEVLIRPA